ncbi:MAG: beta-glucosidase [Gammaproteobacteria bacterium]|nr:MAG: beta-glucosidase [Gammaproteobacteria bacterium]
MSRTRKRNTLCGAWWLIAGLVAGIGATASASAQASGEENPPPYKNAKARIDDRVADLIARMTPEEKFWQLFMVPGDVTAQNKDRFKHGIFGLQVGAAPQGGGAAQQMLNYDTSENAYTLAQKINAMQRYFVEDTRLGIPMLPFDEALHGLVRQGATAFPQSIGLAAGFDPAMLAKVGHAIADEAKVRGLRDLLAPVINIADDVRWGRVEETYGEDPYLTTVMGLAFMGAIEGANVVMTPKHFIANVGDGGRDSYPIDRSARYLEETHFPPFKAAVKQAGIRSLMTAYNSVDGVPATANRWLLTQTLKHDWGFKGFVISDAGAVGGANVLHGTGRDYSDATAQAIGSGLDVIFQTGVEQAGLFMPPFLDGSIAQARIDDAVARVLRAKFQLGLFEHPYVSEQAARNSLRDTSHKALARQAALQSFVLLKNRNGALPLKQPRSLLVLGADATQARLGGYSGTGNVPVSILDGLKQRAGDRVRILYTKGSARVVADFVSVDSAWLSHVDAKGSRAKGLAASYFTSLDLSGKPAVERIDEKVDFQWTLLPPHAALSTDNYSVRWHGEITAPAACACKIGLDGNDGYRLYLDGRLLVDRWDKVSYHTDLVDFDFAAGKPYPIVVEFREPKGNAHIKLVWNAGLHDDLQAQLDAARDLAKQADAIILVAGITEGEFSDRARLRLPGNQEQLIHAMRQMGKPLIVLLVGGSAVTMPSWYADADAILDVWYPGEEGGGAVAATLFGDYNPAGRLPFTWPIDEAQLPLVYNHKPTGRGDDYNNLSGEAMFPFGYGLSYTQFRYSGLHLSRKKISQRETATLSFDLANIGAVDGDEIAQLYIRPLLSTVAQPVLALKGFDRIHLKHGEQRRVTFVIRPETLEVLNKDMQWHAEPGDFRLMVGPSSKELRLKETLSLGE